jgi:hypothetical protein
MRKKSKQAYLEIVSPVVVYRNQNDTASKAPRRPKTIAHATVLALPNFKTISPPFMEALAQRLATDKGVKRAYMHNPDWQFTHPERVGRIGPEIDTLVRACELMVSGIGD